MNFTAQMLLMFYVVNQVSSALIQALPSPNTASNGLYIFIYKFLSLLIADFKSFAAQLPPPPLTGAAAASIEPLHVVATQVEATSSGPVPVAAAAPTPIK